MKTLLLFTFTSVFTLATFTLTGVAHADSISGDARKWAREVTVAVQSNRAKFERVDLSQNALPAEAVNQLDVIVDDQAQVWADTILESDFIAENEVKVDLVETVQSGPVFLGYRVTYSSKAVDTSNCDAARDLASCSHGRIIESSFVEPQLSSWIRDDQNYAKFVPNDPTDVVEEELGE